MLLMWDKIFVAAGFCIIVLMVFAFLFKQIERKNTYLATKKQNDNPLEKFNVVDGGKQ